MPRTKHAGGNLVIVESPAKARTIERYLGAGYRVLASYGHVRDLPKRSLGVDVDGSTRDSRLRAGGISYTYSGENQCYYSGIGVGPTLDWCHRAFMAEPYPGQWNHIANILDPRFHRVGIGIAQVGAAVVIVWDFVD